MATGRICLRVGCPEVVPRGTGPYCDTHRPVLAHGWDNSKPGRAWTSLRKKVMSRDRRRCVICGRSATVVDHLLPEAWGGSDAEGNLRALCGRCHLAKTQHESRLGKAMVKMTPPERVPQVAAFLQTWR